MTRTQNTPPLGAFEEPSDDRLHVTLPAIDDGSESGEIVRWFVRPGDPVEALQPLVEVMFDLATVDVHAPIAGTLINSYFAGGSEVRIGQTLCTLERDLSAESCPF